MENFDISTLNEEQQKALYDTEGAVLVTAGAGSGKTRLLTHRICYLIEEKHISPYNIIAITFTNKAANEMRERIQSMCNKPVWISTFHSMCVRILRSEIEAFGGYTKDFTIIDENDRTKIVKNLCKEQNIEDDVEKVLKHIDNIKNEGLDIDEYFNNLPKYLDRSTLASYARVVIGYEDYLNRSNCLDFDDLLNKTYLLLKSYPNIKAKYAERFQYVLVDEFQDTNKVQYRLVKMLASIHGNLFVVGDEDQCIYSWRGANFQNMFDLKRDFSGLKIYKLERNYRSSKNILSIANNVISNNTERLAKKLWTERDGGEAPIVQESFDERDEAMTVAREVDRLIHIGYKPNEIAVLMRLNALSRPIEEGMLSYQIPYRIYGGQKFFERAEIKLVIAYLNVFANPKDNISFDKIINFPKRGIGDVALSVIKEEASIKGFSSTLEYICSDKFWGSKYHSKLEDFIKKYVEIHADMSTLSLQELTLRVLGDFDIKQAYLGKDEENINKLANIDSFVASVSDFEKENEDATLQDYLAGIMLKSDQDDIGDGGYVAVSTVHAVKGLEFRAVFVVGLEEGVFPLIRKSSGGDVPLSELEEERRLMYVAITRAKERIYLSYVQKRYIYGKTSYQQKSRFLAELNLTFAKPKKKEVVEEQEYFDSGLKVGDKVEHMRFGVGKILEISSDGLVGKIDFDGNVKELMLQLAKLEKVD